jgi:predicted transcriptional regulator
MLSEKKGRPLRRVTITVDPDDYAEMDRLARDQDVSASWLIRRSIREFLHRNRRVAVDPLRRATGKGWKA